MTDVEATRRGGQVLLNRIKSHAAISIHGSMMHLPSVYQLLGSLMACHWMTRNILARRVLQADVH